MSDPKQLPHLLRLLSDDSETVQQALLRALLEFGSTLESELDHLKEPPTPEQRDQIKSLLSEHAKIIFLEKWPHWQECDSDEEQLESALSILAEFQNGVSCPLTLKDLLDELAEEYREAFAAENRNVFTLAEFLFRQKEIQGATEDYYHPRHSNLVYVIENKRGIPISLTCLYMLVGVRLGMAIEGCNFPQHFLARVAVNDEMLFVDCFNQGMFYREAELLKMAQGTAAEVREILRMDANPEGIVARILNNLVTAYETQGDSAASHLMLHLLQAMTDHPGNS
ncbi:MAG: hypothetical protein EXS63_02060 [Candidatus Omnitrophica bacterium]|nr:hypothetical protein [Candidatus Omnitrophota bacterium]